MADEATTWNDLHGWFDLSRIDRGKLYSDQAGVHTNGAEEFSSRMRRAEIGHHHHIAGIYAVRYAQESAWRDDHRRVANGTVVRAVSMLAMSAPISLAGAGIGSERGKPPHDGDRQVESSQAAKSVVSQSIASQSELFRESDPNKRPCTNMAGL
jgi:hypothetical protein